MVRSLLLAFLAGALVIGFAAPGVIGVATAEGGFRMDNAPVQGRATLLEGAVVETSSAPSVVRLQGGQRMQLGAASRGRVYSEHLVLEKGNGLLEGAARYRIEAKDLHVVLDSSNARARVAVREPGQITVAALRGPVHVTTADGTLLARLDPGMALDFAPQGADAAAAPITVSGCLALNPRNHFILNDETANVSFEVNGPDLARFAGQRVSITATILRATQAGETLQVIKVMQITPLSGTCPAPGAAAQSGARAAGMSGTTKAVIAGVVIAAAIGGTAVGLTGDENKSTISR